VRQTDETLWWQRDERMSVTRLIENRLRMCHEIALLAGDARDENLSHCQLELECSNHRGQIEFLGYWKLISLAGFNISFGSRFGRDRSQRLQQKLHDFSRRHMPTHVFAKTAHASEPEEEIKSRTFCILSFFGFQQNPSPCEITN
jgi:hypothetical protein